MHNETYLKWVNLVIFGFLLILCLKSLQKRGVLATLG